MMRHYRIAPMMFAATVASVFCALGGSVSADQRFSITASPSSTEMSIAPGESSSHTMTVLNKGDAAYSFTLLAQPYSVRGMDYDPAFVALPGTTDASSWVTIDAPTSQSLAPDQVANVPYTVHVPPRTQPGGYYAVLFAKTSPAAGSGVMSSSQVGNILYITVKGAVVTNGSASLDAVPRVSFGRSVDLGVKVANTGGTHFVGDVQLTATNPFGHLAFTGTIRRYVLPQTIRDMKIRWDLPAFGLYKIRSHAVVAGKDTTLGTKWILVAQPLALVGVMCITVGVASVVGFGIIKRRRKA